MKRIQWKFLRGLHQLYIEGRTKLKIDNNDYIRHILLNQKKLLRYKIGNHAVLESCGRYNEFYEKEFLDTFNYYNTFFEESGLENNSKKNFTEEDLKALMFVYYNREELRSKLTTQKKLSAQLFRNENSKYIENKPSLKKAILQLLAVDEFPEQDPKNQQWRFVIDCINPRVIVLCENLDCLKIPVEYKKNDIELWYVGGNNTRPLIDISQDKLSLPIFYFCDWDYHGLSIYSKIKDIFRSKNKEIKLVRPNDDAKRLPVKVQHHKSSWNHKGFSDLNRDHYMQEEIDLINDLIIRQEWIEEESMDLIELMQDIK